MKPPVAIAVIEHRGRCAFLQRASGIWTFPSGEIKVNEGETPQAAAVREAKEETGLTIRITGSLGTRIVDDREQHYFSAQAVSGKLTLAEPEKFTKAEWKTADEIIALAGDRLFGSISKYFYHVKTQLKPRGLS